MLLHHIDVRHTSANNFAFNICLVCWSLTSLCHSNGHIETMPAREINPFYCPDQDSIPVSQDTMIDEQSSASGHDYASDRSAIGAGAFNIFNQYPHFWKIRKICQRKLDMVKYGTLFHKK